MLIIALFNAFNELSTTLLTSLAICVSNSLKLASNLSDTATMLVDKSVVKVSKLEVLVTKFDTVVPTFEIPGKDKVPLISTLLIKLAHVSVIIVS